MTYSVLLIILHYHLTPSLQLKVILKMNAVSLLNSWRDNIYYFPTPSRSLLIHFKLTLGVLPPVDAVVNRSDVYTLGTFIQKTALIVYGSLIV